MADKGKALEQSTGPQTGYGTRILLWLTVGIIPPLVYAALVFGLDFRPDDPPLTNRLMQFGFLIVGLVAFNWVFQYRLRWTSPQTPLPGYVFGLAVAESIGLTGLVAYFLTGAELIMIVLVAAALLSGLLLKPRRDE